jgi:hypothetical protein
LNRYENHRHQITPHRFAAHLNDNPWHRSVNENGGDNLAGPIKVELTVKNNGEASFKVSDK